MFTGIITALGTVREVQPIGGGHDMRVVIGVSPEFLREPQPVAIGASIACSGVCLTVVDKSPPGESGWFAVDASGETLSRTAQGQWTEGRRLNLERAMKLGDEMGGHIVTGHVDGVAEVLAVAAEGDSKRIDIAVPADLAPYLATKGSITIDCVSLTVNGVADEGDLELYESLGLDGAVVGKALYEGRIQYPRTP